MPTVDLPAPNGPTSAMILHGPSLWTAVSADLIKQAQCRRQGIGLSTIRAGPNDSIFRARTRSADSTSPRNLKAQPNRESDPTAVTAWACNHKAPRLLLVIGQRREAPCALHPLELSSSEETR